MEIPVINLARPEAEIARQMRAACTAHGFLSVADHGVPAALVEDAFAWAARLFALPEESKQAIHLFRSTGKRGWERLGAQTLDAGAQPDRKESFYCGVHYGPDHPYVRAGLNGYGPNQWPDGLPGFAPAMGAYIAAVTRLAERLMRDLARSLDLPAEYFDATMAEPMITLRLCRYPPQPADAGGDVFGAGAHTDWGAITILAQDDLGGLQVQAADGTWVAARPIPGTFIVNLGDMIPRWTNGLYRSNRQPMPTRVIRPGERLTLAGAEFVVDQLGPCEAAEGMTLLHSEANSLLVAADLFGNRATPYLLDGTTRRWISELEKAAPRYAGVRTALPGHGAAAAAAPLIADQLAYLREFHALVRGEARGAASLDDAAKARIRMAVEARYPGAPLVAPLPSLIEMNAEAVAKELAGT